MRTHFALAFAVLVVACAPVEGAPAATAHRMTGADVTLHMRDGRVFDGVVQADDDDAIYLDTGEGRVVARKEAIVRVELHTSPAPVDPQRRGLGPGGAVAIVLGGLTLVSSFLYLLFATPGSFHF